ncbi:MAG: hypothetical protein V9G04_16915 [Nocardioides sp.]
MRSIIAAATAWSPNTPPQPLNGRLDGEDQGGVFVAAGHELEEQVRGVLFEGQVADLVDDDQPVAAQPGELLGQPAGPVGVGESGDPLCRGCEQDAVAVSCGGDAQGGGQMGLPGPGRAEQDDVACLGQEPARCQRADLGADGWLGVEVEVFQRLHGTEPGGADPELCT